MIYVGSKVVQTDNYYITHKYDGFDKVDFDISANDSNFSDIVENAVITTATNRYLITKIDGSGDKLHVSAELDLRDWKTRIYENYDNGSMKLADAIAEFIPTGWTFENTAQSNIYRTLRLDGGTPIDMLIKCSNLYKVQLKFDTLEKKVYAINPDSYTLTPAFVTEELNLRALNYYGDSSNLITRLEARGSNGLTFADINDGKTYVENNTYSSDVIYGYWKDERYMDKVSLLEAATAKLAELSTPARSYECDVIDLKSINPDEYSAQDLSLYQKISLKDIRRNVSLTYQVVEVKEYPHYPEKNVITLSSNAPKLSNMLIEIEDEIQEFNETATNWLTDNEGGVIYFIRDDEGRISSEVLKVGDGANAPVWVRNKNGIFYSPDGINGTPIVAMTANGEIVADFVTTGVLRGGKYTDASDVENYRVTLDLDNGTFNIQDTNGRNVFNFDGSGNLSVKGDISGSTGTFSGSLSGADITGATGTFSGDITANSGHIGSWTIQSDGSLKSEGNNIVLKGGSGTNECVEIGNLRVEADGNDVSLSVIDATSNIYIYTKGYIYMGSSSTTSQNIVIDPSNGTIQATII